MKKTDVIIVGAGASGLYLAHRLLNQKIDFVLLEQSEDVGGLIQEGIYQNAKVPIGPRVFLAKRAQTLQHLAETFQEPILYHNPPLKRFLLGSKGLYPLSKKVIFKNIGGVIKYLMSHPKSCEETIWEYFSSFFNQEFIQEVIDPMSFGIWAASPSELSMDILMGNIKQKKLFSQKGPKGLIAFPSGLKTLFNKVAISLKDHLYLKTQVNDYKIDREGIYVETNRGRFLTQKLVIATSFFDMKQFVKDGVLEDMKTSSIDVVTFCFDKKQKREKGSGYLIPTNRGFKTKGVLFDADLLGYEKIDMLSCFIQNSFDPEKEAFEELLKILPDLDAYDKAFVNSYKNSIFQCSLGANDKLLSLEKKLNKDQIYLLGAFPKVGLYDCLEKASKVFDTISSTLTHTFCDKS